MKRVVFCDFDGTITAVETFVGMLKKFAPQLSAELIPQMYERQLTLRDGVRQLFESIASDRYGEVIAYADQQPIRPGLSELLDFLDTQNVPFVVISGGMRGMVERVLSRAERGKPISERVAAVWAVDIDTSRDYLRVSSACESETELVAKVQVMEKYPAEETIAIGDSVSDINMAIAADIVFARDRLVHYLEPETYIRWNDFFDIRDRLAERWQ